MQAKSIDLVNIAYDVLMKTGRPTKSQRTDFAQHLRQLREAAGLSQRQIAKLLGISQPSYAEWEQHNVALKPEQLLKLADVLGVRIEELFEKDSSAKPRGGPVGKAKRLFEETSKLPRSQQQKIAEVVEALLSRHKQAA
jgi:transcriptional regulator with XRE-family HTH domain